MPHCKAFSLKLPHLCTSVFIIIQLALINRVLSTAGALGANIICGKIPGLSPRQRGICENHPRAIVAVGEGARLGLEECHRQFSGMRWNCSNSLADQSLFGHHHVYGTKEAAYSHSITSAAVSYAITQACSTGNLGNACGCDRSKKHGKLSPKGWKWGGCSADWKYGVRYSKRFLDAGEQEETSRALMNVHNNAAGRKAIRVNMSKSCKCHGVSGACTVKTCWVTLPKFNVVGDHLLRKFQKAKRVTPIHGKRALQPVNLRLKRKAASHKKPRNGDLVYLHSSPDYCEADNGIGSLGTNGRQCNSDISKGKNSCDLLCCNRGYHTQHFTQTTRCKCKFHWCCNVTCDTCVEKVEVNTCK